MLEIKEVVNTINQQEFISKKYLRDKVLFAINFDAIDVVKAKRDNTGLYETHFSNLNGAIHLASHVGIITKAEKDAFMDLLLDCVFYLGCDVVPHLHEDGKVTTEVIKD